MNARDLLNPSHPVHNHFLSWLKGKQPSVRQARKFLNAFPNYRDAQKV